jgi:anti-anti-sigma factor
MFHIQQRKEETLTLIDIAGVFDNEAHDPVAEIVKVATGQEQINLIWNFDGISSINSSGIAILLNATVEIAKHGGISKLVNVSPAVLEVFDIHKVLPAVDIYADEEAAKKKVSIDRAEKEKAYTRLFERLDVTLKAKFRHFKKSKAFSFMHRFHTAEAKSVSMCGIYLQTSSVEAPNTLLEVKFMLPEGSPDSEISSVCKVVWAADKEKQKELYPGLALCTMHMNSREKAKLEAFLTSRGL